MIAARIGGLTGLHWTFWPGFGFGSRSDGGLLTFNLLWIWLSLLVAATAFMSLLKRLSRRRRTRIPIFRSEKTTRSYPSTRRGRCHANGYISAASVENRIVTRNYPAESDELFAGYAVSSNVIPWTIRVSTESISSRRTCLAVAKNEFELSVRATFSFPVVSFEVLQTPFRQRLFHCDRAVLRGINQ